MAGKGFAPQPIAVLKQKGTFRKDRHSDDLDKSALAFFNSNNYPMPPEDITGMALQIWNTQIANVAKVGGWVAESDRPLFIRYCKVCGMIDNLESVLDGEYFFTDKNGMIRVHPAFTELQKLDRLHINLCQEFGFSPSARTRVKMNSVSETKEDNYGF